MDRKLLKKKLTSLATVGLMVLGTSGMAQESGNLSQLEMDHNDVISRCLTFNHLDSEVPSVSLTDLAEYEIMDHGVEFHFSTDFTVNEHSVSLITKGDANTGSEPFFLFHTLRIEDNSAFVKYNFVYYVGGQKNIKPVEISFVKEEGSWTVENYSL